MAPQMQASGSSITNEEIGPKTSKAGASTWRLLAYHKQKSTGLGLLPPASLHPASPSFFSES